MSAVAIDGPAGAGKSTVAKLVAERLGYTYVDTGAMYRALALASIERSMDDPQGLAELARTLPLSTDDGRIILDGADVSERIRDPDVTERVSKVAAYPQVRQALVARQRMRAADDHVVMEGRDIGTAVLPDASVKIYLTASLEERARRRSDETGHPVDEVRAAIEARDNADSKRSVSPLTRAIDAVEIDTTGLSIEDVVERIVTLARAASGGVRGDGTDG